MHILHLKQQIAKREKEKKKPRIIKRQNLIIWKERACLIKKKVSYSFYDTNVFPTTTKLWAKSSFNCVTTRQLGGALLLLLESVGVTHWGNRSDELRNQTQAKWFKPRFNQQRSWQNSSKWFAYRYVHCLVTEKIFSVNEYVEWKLGDKYCPRK